MDLSGNDNEKAVIHLTKIPEVSARESGVRFSHKPQEPCEKISLPLTKGEREGVVFEGVSSAVGEKLIHPASPALARLRPYKAEERKIDKTFERHSNPFLLQQLRILSGASIARVIADFHPPMPLPPAWSRAKKASRNSTLFSTRRLMS